MKVTYHPPDPRVGPKCDLCLVGAPAWRHPVGVFALKDLAGGVMVIGAEGAVVACDACSSDLEGGDHKLPDLETRAVEAFGAYGQAHFPPLRAWLHQLHHGILQHLAGPRSSLNPGK